MLTTSSDLATLMTRVAAKDRAAFEQVYGATSAKLYGIILRILRRRELADEVLQEVYVRIWERAGDFAAAQGSPITWMATIARNRALDEVRRRQPVVMADDGADVLAVADPGPLASEIIMREEAGRQLARCLDGLDTEKAQMVRLAYLEGWSREELAQEFGAPVATIKTWLHRSLKQLKDCLGS